MDTPRAYPVALHLQGRLCVVVGGGRVALRKVQGLVATGARIRVVAPRVAPQIAELAGVEVVRREFCAADLSGAFLVFAATDAAPVNAAVADAARARGVAVNVADDGGRGDFVVPAVLRRDTLTVAVSSDGASPALAARVRDELGAVLGPEWGTVCAIVAALRRKELTGAKGTTYNSSVVERLLAAGLPVLAARGDCDAIDRLLRREAGGATLSELDIRLEKGRT